MFEIYNLETSFTPQYVKKRTKTANVFTSLMDFNQKKDGLDNFDYNVKHFLRNEIKSKSIANNEFGVDSISNVGRTFNFAYTKILFKDYLEDNNMKVYKLQVIINDLYNSFVNDVPSKKPINKKCYSKLSSRNVIENDIGAKTQNNLSKNKLC